MAFPTFQAAGAFVESASANVSPAWPTHQADDVALLVVEANHWPIQLATPAGFKELPLSPQMGGGLGATSAAGLAVFWKRATGAAEAAPTVEKPVGASHIRAVIITFRGCATQGNPWNVLAAGRTSSASTSVSLPAVTTTDADCLVVHLVTNSQLTSTPQGSGWSNASLTNVTEQVDSNSAIGNGSGLTVVTGQRASAGSIGSTTGTLANASHQGLMTLALTAVNKAADTTPWVCGVGTPAERDTAGDVSPAWPAGHAANDIGLLVVETGGWPIATPTGWTQVNASPQNAGTSGSTAGTGLAVFWKRAAGGAEAAPNVTFVADHIRALILTVRDCITSGNPIDYSQGNAESSAVLDIIWPDLNTQVDKVAVIGIATHSKDASAPQLDIGNLTPNGLEFATLFLDSPSIIGNGSGFCFVRGRKASAGAMTGPTSRLQGSTGSLQARISVALRPTAATKTLDAASGNVPIGGTAATLRKSHRLALDKGAVAVTGFTMTLSAKFKNYVLLLEKGALPVSGGDMTFKTSVSGWSKDDPVDNTWTKDTPL